MREILFRGKNEYKGWVYGDLRNYEKSGAKAIFSHELLHRVEVDPSTVGQFTGLTDKHGKKIFEGDIIRIFSNDYMGFDEIGKCEFKDGCFGVSYFPVWERKYSFGSWHFHRIGQISKWQDMGASGEVKYTYEVIGNIHDNPELLEVSE